MNKVELHCHLDAILGPTMAQDIHQEDPSFPVHPSAFEQLGRIQDVESFFSWITVIDPIEGELDHFYPIVSRHIAQLKNQNVLYAELMIGSSEIPMDPLEAAEKLVRFRRWVTQQEAGEIQVEFLVAFGRNRSPEFVEELSDRIIRLYQADLVVGIALAGPEKGKPVRPFQRSLAKLREAGLGIEIHAGEWCGPESVWEALEYGCPDRLGHGVSAFQDSELIEAIQERNIHIEFCPTSNLSTGSVAQLDQHPVQKAREMQLDYSINTDDPGAFDCSMESELALLVDHFGFDQDELNRVFENALRARFQPELRIKGRIPDELIQQDA